MQIASGRVRRKTEPTGPGFAMVIFSKIDTYGNCPLCTYLFRFVQSNLRRSKSPDYQMKFLDKTGECVIFLTCFFRKKGNVIWKL